MILGYKNSLAINICSAYLVGACSLSQGGKVEHVSKQRPSSLQTGADAHGTGGHTVTSTSDDCVNGQHVGNKTNIKITASNQQLNLHPEEEHNPQPSQPTPTADPTPGATNSPIVDPNHNDDDCPKPSSAKSAGSAAAETP